MYRWSMIVLFALLLSHSHCDEEKYTDEFDYINAAEILENDDLREQYYKCFMDEGPCITKDQIFFKGLMAEILTTRCKKCTDKQKENMEITVSWYNEKRPDEWGALIEKLIEKAENENQKN